MKDLAEALIAAAAMGVAWAFAWMVVKLSLHWTMKKVSETGARPELIASLRDRGDSPGRYAALKWGMVAVALGVGVGLGAVLPYGFDDPVAYAVLLVLGGGALVLYYRFVDDGPAGRNRVDTVGGRSRERGEGRRAPGDTPESGPRDPEPTRERGR